MATTWESPGAVMSTPGQASRQHSHALRNLYHDATADEPGPEVTIPFQEYLPRRIPETVRLPLAVAGHTLVDASDAAWAANFRWQRTGSRKASVATYGGPRSHRRPIYLHRLIVGAVDGQEVDHINGDAFDNRRANLRTVTRSQNMQNLRRARRGSTTGVRNVIWRAQYRTFHVEIQVNKKRIWVGSFATLADADAAAQAARRQHMTHAPECAGGAS